MRRCERLRQKRRPQHPDNEPREGVAGREVKVDRDAASASIDKAIAVPRVLAVAPSHAARRSDAPPGDLEMDNADERVASGKPRAARPRTTAPASPLPGLPRRAPPGTGNDRVLYNWPARTSRAAEMELAMKTLDRSWPSTETRYTEEAQFRRGEMLFRCATKRRPSRRSPSCEAPRRQPDLDRALYMQGGRSSSKPSSKRR